jgi:DNA-binding MarR family transcriptional regulator
MNDAHRKILEKNEITEAWQISWLANFFSGPIYSIDFRQHDFGRTEFIILFCIHNASGLTSTEICLASGRPRNSISRSVRRLLDDGWIEAEEDTADHRRNFLTLTALGQSKLDEVLGYFEKRNEELLAPLSRKDRQTLATLLKRLTLRDDDFGAMF